MVVLIRFLLHAQGAILQSLIVANGEEIRLLKDASQ